MARKYYNELSKEEVQKGLEKLSKKVKRQRGKNGDKERKGALGTPGSVKQKKMPWQYYIEEK